MMKVMRARYGYYDLKITHPELGQIEELASYYSLSKKEVIQCIMYHGLKDILTMVHTQKKDAQKRKDEQEKNRGSKS